MGYPIATYSLKYCKICSKGTKVLLETTYQLLMNLVCLDIPSTIPFKYSSLTMTILLSEYKIHYIKLLSNSQIRPSSSLTFTSQKKKSKPSFGQDKKFLNLPLHLFPLHHSAPLVVVAHFGDGVWDTTTRPPPCHCAPLIHADNLWCKALVVEFGLDIFSREDFDCERCATYTSTARH